MRGTRGESGQAAVELVALLPLIALVGALLLQAVLAGQALWLCQSAARAAARAQAVGANAELAARRTLPARLERGLQVRPTSGGGVRVRVEIPSVVGADLGSLSDSARMEPQR